MFRYFWFLCATVMAANLFIWRRLLADGVTRGALTADEADRFTRGAAIWLIGPCLLLGSIALAAGWSDPFCAGVLSFRDVPSAATSLVIVGLWAVFLGWLWLGRGATVLGRVQSALRDPPSDVSPRVVRIVASGAVVASAVGAMAASRRLPGRCAFVPSSGPAAETPGLQTALLLLAAATWLIGGNVLVARHHRRVGRSPWSGFRPFAFPVKDFDVKEWLTLVALVIVSLAFAAMALSLGSR